MITSEAKKFMALNPKEPSLFDKNDKGSVEERWCNVKFQVVDYKMLFTGCVI